MRKPTSPEISPTSTAPLMAPDDKSRSPNGVTGRWDDEQNGLPPAESLRLDNLPQPAGSTAPLPYPSSHEHRASASTYAGASMNRPSVIAHSEGPSDGPTSQSRSSRTSRLWSMLKMSKGEREGIREAEPSPLITAREMGRDEFHLARTGYFEVFKRTLTPIDNFLAVMATMNFTSTMPAIFFIYGLSIGGPLPALVNWILIGAMSIIVALCLGEISAAFPTSGGLFFYSYKLAGEKYGPFLAWMTGWLSWVGWMSMVPAVTQLSVSFLTSMLLMYYPENHSIQDGLQGWLQWILTALTLTIFAFIPNTLGRRALRIVLRCCLGVNILLFLTYIIALPVGANHGDNKIHPENLHTISNWINADGYMVASNGYCWVMAALFPAWIFNSFEVAIHMSEETKQATRSVPNGMWRGTLLTYVLGIPALVIIIICMQNQTAIGLSHTTAWFAVYLEQVVGKKVGGFILIVCWLDAALSAAVFFMSAQRLTWAAARDGILPGGKWISKVASKSNIPVNAGIVVYVFGLVVAAVSVKSAVAFQAVLAVSVVAQNLSYGIVITARHTIARHSFVPAGWKLGAMSLPLGIIAVAYIVYLLIILILPFQFPVNADHFNFSPVGLAVLFIVAGLSWHMPVYGQKGKWHGPRTNVTQRDFEAIRVETHDHGNATARPMSPVKRLSRSVSGGFGRAWEKVPHC